MFHFRTQHDDARRLRSRRFGNARCQLILAVAIGDGQGVVVSSGRFFDGYDEAGEELGTGDDTAGFTVD